MGGSKKWANIWHLMGGDTYSFSLVLRLSREHCKTSIWPNVTQHLRNFQPKWVKRPEEPIFQPHWLLSQRFGSFDSAINFSIENLSFGDYRVFECILHRRQMSVGANILAIFYNMEITPRLLCCSSACDAGDACANSPTHSNAHHHIGQIETESSMREVPDQKLDCQDKQRLLVT